ncbi:MAG: LysM peptidoglycan-binding domain-containing protein [Actinomycetota bacterium]|nr:LysM peptidoglycan-binding domain-containing protein [Actinomycetota bacterium]
MPIPQGFQRAKLQIDGGDTIDCGFNPQSYSVAKTNVWSFKPSQSKDLPAAEFGGGLPMQYKLALLLDSSLAGPNEDVRKQADDLMKAMHGGGSAPRFITFSWGSVTLPKAAAIALSIQYALFHPNGLPIRAFVDLELAQAEDASTASAPSAGQPQNPTTRAVAEMRVHRVKDGDSLPSIAYDYYGDANPWRTIAEANDVADPLHLRRGSELAIPRLET